MARKIPFARTAWRFLRSLSSGLSKDAAGAGHKVSQAVMKRVDTPNTASLDGLKAYQIAALKEMPDYTIPPEPESVARLPTHVQGIIGSVAQTPLVPQRIWTLPLNELSEVEFEELLTVRAMECALPVDVLSGLLAVKSRIDSPADVLQYMRTYWRRLRHWNDVRDLASMIMWRRFDWSGPAEADPVTVKAGRDFRDDGYAILPGVLTSRQATEVHDYFISRPGLNRHVPDGCPDQIRRYVGYGADDHSFCAYPLCDIVLAPHLLEALVNPRIAEIGLRGFGAIPRLWKIFAHWDLPGSKFLEQGTSIGHYHRDLNDIGMMWIYLYLTDVDRDCGPHGIVPGSQSYKNISAWLQEANGLGVDTRYGDRHLVPEDFFDGYGYQVSLEVKEAMFADREVVITGPAGTAVISNGFNYHRIVSPQFRKRLICAARYYLTEPQQLESPDRDTDKIPFGLVKDRIGDSELIREMTKGVVDWRPPRSSRRTPETVLDADRKCFLIVSNGRSGSTLLATSLGQLNGVRTDFEYRWALPRGAEGNPIHYVIPDHPATVSESLIAFAGDAHFVGSKLTFSLEWTQRQNVFEKIDLYFDKSITYIFLTRAYIETLASFLLRGPVHDVEQHAESKSDNVMLNQLRTAFEEPVVDQRSFVGDAQDVFRALKSLVNNDVIGFELCQRFPSHIHVSYSRIADDFERVVRAIGWAGNVDEARSAIDKPLVRKLPVLDYSEFPKSDVFVEYANKLGATLQKAIMEKWAVENLERAQKSTLDALGTALNNRI